jgi:hypothetical protein
VKLPRIGRKNLNELRRRGRRYRPAHRSGSALLHRELCDARRRVALLNGLAAVDPGDLDVARFFVYALLGADSDKSPYTQTGERIARLAAGGIRLVVGDQREDVTKTRKDGGRGRPRFDYGDHRDSQAAVAWLWKFVLCRVEGYAEPRRRGARFGGSALLWGIMGSG